MAIAMVCPHCEALYKLADDQAGKRVRCRQCQQPFDVPGPRPASRAIGIHRIERPLGVPRPTTPPTLPPRQPPPMVALPASEPGPDRLDEEDREHDREPRFREPLDDPLPTPNNVVLLVGLGLGGALVLIFVLCAGLIWYTTRQVGRGVDRMIDQAKKGQPPITLPPQLVSNQQEALAALRSVDARQRQRAAEWFITQFPDPDPRRRAEVRAALQPLLNDPDFAVRGAARNATNLWQ